MPLVDMVSPALTTVRIPHAAMGREAAHLLLRAMRGDPPGPLQVVLGLELIVRGSTAPVSGRLRRRVAG